MHVNLYDARLYLLSFIEELRWGLEIEQNRLPFLGGIMLLEALGRAIWMNPSSLLEVFLPERYANNEYLSRALNKINSRPVSTLSINDDNDPVKVQLTYDPDEHLEISQFLIMRGGPDDLQGIVVRIDPEQFLNDIELVVQRVFQEAEGTDLLMRKLKVAFNTFRFIGFE